MPDTQGSQPSRGAATVFADYLVRVSIGEDVDIEEYCVGHPALAAEIRRMHAAWEKKPQPKGYEPPSSVDEQFTSAMLGRLSGRTGFRRYHLKEEIARGGMGRIQRVWDEDLRRTLAMKFLLTGDVDGKDHADPRALSYFLEEAQVTAQLDHPGIVPVHEVGVDPSGNTYFTMKLVKGRELEKIIQLARAGDENWTITRALGVLQRVCETLAYAHDKGVVHRDLKPANVMVGRFGEAYVMDWGLAKVLGAEQREARIATAGSGSGAESLLDPERPAQNTSGVIVGTPAYMAPEQAHGRPVGALADVYAAGAMLYQLLSGERPYMRAGQEPSGAEIVERVRNGPPVAVNRIDPRASEELQAICERAMAREPEDRYPSALAMAEDLRAYLEGRVVQAHRTGPWMEFRKWVTRNKGVATALAGVILVSFAGAGTTAFVEMRGRQKAEEERDRTRVGLHLRVLRELAEENTVASFWPPLPDKAAYLQEWIDDTTEVAEGLPAHRAKLEKLNEELDVILAAEIAGSEPLQEVRDHAFLNEIMTASATLPERMDYLRTLFQFAESVEQRTLTGADAVQRWNEAIADVARLYDGFPLEPQLGLLPLRRDPKSSMWEFWHVLSGEEPDWSGDGPYELTPATGIVLVLLPGGTTTIGARPPSDEHPVGEPHVDPLYQVLAKDEGPPVEVRLDAFFISKYEMTAPQWERLMGSNPSQRATSSLHPVDTVDWNECCEAARRLDLEVPTEAQWEYACRAGTTTPYFTGEDPSTLIGSANLADDSYRATGLNPQHPILDGFDDGHPLAAPVGALEPNPFGLHDMLGNVYEWCRDAYLRVVQLREGDGLRGPGVLPSLEAGTIRGGSWTCDENVVRSANRHNWGRSAKEADTGLRPMRRVRGAGN